MEMGAKSKIRQIRVSPEEDRRLVELAEAKGVTVSDLLRDGALRRRVPARAAELEPVGGSGSAAPGFPAPVAPAAGHANGPPTGSGNTAAAGEVERESAGAVAVFRCPECVFEARSPAVRCPVHGVKVVSA